MVRRSSASVSRSSSYSRSLSRSPRSPASSGSSVGSSRSVRRRRRGSSWSRSWSGSRSDSRSRSPSFSRSPSRSPGYKRGKWSPSPPRAARGTKPPARLSNRHRGASRSFSGSSGSFSRSDSGSRSRSLSPARRNKSRSPDSKSIHPRIRSRSKSPQRLRGKRGGDKDRRRYDRSASVERRRLAREKDAEEKRKRQERLRKALVVDKLSAKVTQEHVREMFAVFGPLTDVSFDKSPADKAEIGFKPAKGACLIEFEKLSDAGEALDKMDGGEVDGVQVGVARLQEFESRRVMERREMATEGPARGGRRRSPIRADRGPLGSGGRGRRRFQSPGRHDSPPRRGGFGRTGGGRGRGRGPTFGTTHGKGAGRPGRDSKSRSPINSRRRVERPHRRSRSPSPPAVRKRGRPLSPKSPQRWNRSARDTRY